MDKIAPNAPSPPNFRCTFSLPQSLAKEINLIAKRLRMSQSALLALLLEEPIAQLAKLASLLPPDPGTDVPVDTARRLRGQSIDLLRTMVTETLAEAKGLDPGLDLDIDTLTTGIAAAVERGPVK